jgi:hypothetical protein
MAPAGLALPVTRHDSIHNSASEQESEALPTYFRQCRSPFSRFQPQLAAEAVGLIKLI